MPELHECVERSVLGRADGECELEPDGDLCTGLKRSLQNFRRPEQCTSRAGSACIQYSYKQNSQAQWLSVASGYVAAFKQCVTKNYGSDDDNGFHEALADGAFIAYLKSLDDGGAQLEFKTGTILERTLKGENFPSIFRSSKLQGTFTREERESFLIGAETVFPIPDFLGTAEEKTNFAPRTRHSFEPAPPARAPAGEAKPIVKITPPAPPSAPVEEKRRYMPYSLGLDRSLFERVRAVYRLKAPAMRGFDDYIKRLPASPEEPTDVRDLIKRGRTIEL